MWKTCDNEGIGFAWFEDMLWSFEGASVPRTIYPMYADLVVMSTEVVLLDIVGDTYSATKVNILPADGIYSTQVRCIPMDLSLASAPEIDPLERYRLLGCEES